MKTTIFIPAHAVLFLSYSSTILVMGAKTQVEMLHRVFYTVSHHTTTLNLIYTCTKRHKIIIRDMMDRLSNTTFITLKLFITKMLHLIILANYHGSSSF